MIDLLGIDSSKVYCLVRVSSNLQDFQSQWQGIQSYCKNNNIELLENHVIEEQGISGFSTPIEQRKGLNKVLELAKANKIQLLIVFNMDRIGRRTDLVGYIDQLTKLNVLILSVTEGIINDKTSDTSDLLVMIKSWVASYESKKTSKRVRSGKLASSKAGKYNGGVVLLGYVKIGDRLAIDKDKVPIIRTMYEKYISGGSKLALEYLESVGIHKVNQSLLQLIRNPQYKGIQNHGYKYYEKQDRLSDYNEIMFYNKDLQIVSTEVWEKANQLRLARKTNRRGCNVLTDRTDKLLESLCYCGVCGGKLTLQKDYRGKDTKYILQCRKCKELKSTTQKNWSYNKIERLVNSKIEEILAYEINEDKLLEHYNSKKNSNINELEQILELKSRELVEKEKGISKANSNLEKMLVSDISVDMIELITDKINKFKVEAEELKKDISELEQQINQEQQINEESNNKIKLLLQVKELYARANKEQQKKLLQILVQKIEIKGKDNIKIYLNY